VLTVTCDRIDLGDGKVYFATNQARIQRKSYGLLDQVAETLRLYPDIRRIRIEGHTDDRGRDRYNQKLSQMRVDSVGDYLSKKGIDPKRLEAVGYGETRPIATNKTRAGRAQNRRVEIVVVERIGCP